MARRRRTATRSGLGRAALVTLALLVSILGLAVNPAPAHACSCARNSLANALDRADVAFLGSVERNRTVKRPAPRHNELTFKVARVYKGSAYREQLVVTPPSTAECGLDPAPGTEFIIFATQQTRVDGSRQTAALITSLCNGNLSTSAPPSLLGNGYAPFSGSSEQVDRATRMDESVTRALTVGGITTLVLLALAGIGLSWLWRRPAQ
jgi:hypothetical protein